MLYDSNQRQPYPTQGHPNDGQPGYPGADNGGASPFGGGNTHSPNNVSGAQTN